MAKLIAYLVTAIILFVVMMVVLDLGPIELIVSLFFLFLFVNFRR